MGRIFRTEEPLFEVIGFRTIDGEITSQVDDRFCHEPEILDLYSGEITSGYWSVGQNGLSGFRLSDIQAMGFDTNEYAAMLRFEAATNFEDRIRSEDELNVVMEYHLGWIGRPPYCEIISAVRAARLAKAETDRDTDEREASERFESQVREYARY